MNGNKIETEANEYKCITNKVVQNNSFENSKRQNSKKGFQYFLGFQHTRNVVWS